MEETLRTWHSGPPPHVGWWNASAGRFADTWRWWNGVQWSLGYFESSRAAFIKIRTIPKRLAPDVRWSDYYPEGARVPRVDPANPYITPMLPALNAGSLYAWEEAGRRMRATPAEQDEAWRAISTGQRTGESRPQNPGARDLAGVSTRDLMTELFRRVG